MNTVQEKDIWIYRIAGVLSLMVIASILSMIVRAVFTWPAIEFPGVLGVAALAGLARLLASPLNRGLFG